MDADRPRGSSQPPEEARAPRQFPRLAGLGALLVVAGMAMILTSYAYGRDPDGPTWTGSVSNLGLATTAVGAGIIVWRAVVKFRRHGPLAAVFAGVVGLGLALLLAVAAAAVAFGVLVLLGN